MSTAPLRQYVVWVRERFSGTDREIPRPEYERLVIEVGLILQWDGLAEDHELTKRAAELIHKSQGALLSKIAIEQNNGLLMFSPVTERFCYTTTKNIIRILLDLQQRFSERGVTLCLNIS